jgi:methylmalonyl-CoA carboxyltransferase small subunit
MLSGQEGSPLKLKITVDGKTYEVDVEVAEAEPPHPGYVPPTGPARLPGSVPVTPPPAPTSATPVADESKVSRSPISGVVVRVAVQPGQTIKVDDVLLVLEAMKMETVITSPRAGKVAKVNVAAGAAVQAGQVLVEFE